MVVSHVHTGDLYADIMGSGSSHDDGYAVITTGLWSSKGGFSGAFASSSGAAQAKRRMPLQSRPNTTVKIPKTAIVAMALSRAWPLKVWMAIAPAIPTCWIPVSIDTVRAVRASAPMTTLAKPYPSKKPTGHMSAMTANALGVIADLRGNQPVGRALASLAWRSAAKLDFYTVVHGTPKSARTHAATNRTAPMRVAHVSVALPAPSRVRRSRQPRTAGVVATINVTTIAR